MSGFQHREGSGSLWPNKDKTADNHPNTKGEIMLDGVVYEIAGWTRESKNGQKFISLAGKRKGQRSEAPRREAPRSAPPQQRDEIDDEIPF